MGLCGASTSAKRATTSSTATMPAPMSAVVLFRRRRNPWANGDSARADVGVHATSGGAGSSASRRLPPRMAGSLLSSLMASSGVPDPRIQESVGEIDDQVDDDERERRHEREALHLLVVARDDGIDAEGAEPGHREECLHHDGPADEEAHLEAHHGNCRDQRVIERVIVEDRPTEQGLGALGGTVLREKDLVQSGA